MVVSAHPFVSVIVITRNRAPWLRTCLEHLYRQEYEPFEVVVVDSSSNEETQAVLDELPQVKRLRIPDGRNNMPQARNLGIEHAVGEIVAFIDDDCYVHDGWLSHLVAHYTDPWVGGVGGRIVDPTRPPRGQGVGLIRLDSPEIVANFVVDTGNSIEVEHLCGGNMSFRREVFSQVGGFDPLYGGHNRQEETDFCIRVGSKGWKLIYEPKAVADHVAGPKEGRKRLEYNRQVILYEGHNRAYFFLKNFGYRYQIIEHFFGGMPFLFITLCLKRRERQYLEEFFFFSLGASWGLVDSLIIRLREVLSRA
jgi:glycosyltransferase involved in cell wall biosynthesis